MPPCGECNRCNRVSLSVDDIDGHINRNRQYIERYNFDNKGDPSYISSCIYDRVCYEDS